MVGFDHPRIGLFAWSGSGARLAIRVVLTFKGDIRGATLRDAPHDFQASAGLVGPAARRPRLRTVGWACSVQGFGTGAGPGVVAQRESTRLITWVSRVRFPSTTRRSRLRSRLLRDADNVSTWARGERSTGRSALA